MAGGCERMLPCATVRINVNWLTFDPRMFVPWPLVLSYPRLAPILTPPTFAKAASDNLFNLFVCIFGLNGLTCSVLLFITSNFGSWYADCRAFCPEPSSYEDRTLAAWSKKKPSHVCSTVIPGSEKAYFVMFSYRKQWLPGRVLRAIESW